MSHEHMCGHTDIAGVLLYGAAPGFKGCGNVWSHADKEGGFDSEQEWADTHTCPRCGAGPWTLKYFGVKCDEFSDRDTMRAHNAAGDRQRAEKDAQQQVQEG